MGKGLGFGGGSESVAPRPQQMTGQLNGKRFIPGPKPTHAPASIMDSGLKIDMAHLGIKNQYISTADLLDCVGFEKHFAAFKAMLASEFVAKLQELRSQNLGPEKAAIEKDKAMAHNVLCEISFLTGSLQEWLYAKKDVIPNELNYIMRALSSTIANNDKLIKDHQIIKFTMEGTIEGFNKLVSVFLIRCFPKTWFKDSRNIANASANYLINRINDGKEDRDIKAAIETLTELILMKSALTLDDKKKISAGALRMADYMKASLGATKYRQYPLLPDFQRLAAAFAQATHRS
jgi:hypothetical protein